MKTSSMAPDRFWTKARMAATAFPALGAALAVMPDYSHAASTPEFDSSAPDKGHTVNGINDLRAEF